MNERSEEMLEEALARWRERMRVKPAHEQRACDHEWGTAYKSSGGRKVCVKCGYVTPPTVQL
jgi:hypothetical protein